MPDGEGLAIAADGTPIWWEHTGRGDPPVLLSDGIGCAGFIWNRLSPALARSRRVLHWNYRGHGRSGRPADLARCTLADCAADLLTVLDAAGEPSAVLAGHSMGVQVVLEAYRRAPERVAGLILACGSPGRPLDTFHGRQTLGQLFPAIKEAVLAFPQTARMLFERVLPSEAVLQYGLWLEVNRRLVRREDLMRYLQDASRVDPEVLVRILDSAAVADATDLLPSLRTPALVIGGERDTFTPVELSMRMHAAIPDADWLLLPAGSHMGLLEHAELVELRVEKFLAQRCARRGGAPDQAERA